MFLRQSTKSFLIVLAAILIMKLFPALLFAEAVVYLSPNEKEVAPNQAFPIDIFVSNVDRLAGYQFGLSYNPELYAIQSITKGDFLSSSGSPIGTFFFNSPINNTTGILSFATEAILGPYNISGSGLLATVNFMSLSASGVDTISIPDSSLKLSSSGGIAISRSLGDMARVTVTPEPISCVLFAIGGAVFASRRLLKRGKKI